MIPVMDWLRRARRGTWRVAVIEDSMRPSIEPGDWLLTDPTATAWPRPGSVVVFREPGSGLLAVKRVAARAGHVAVPEGLLHLEPGEAWLLGDALLLGEPDGRSVDSRSYGPVSFDRYVGRAWFRYGPLRRVGRIGRPGSQPDRDEEPNS